MFEANLADLGQSSTGPDLTKVMDEMNLDDQAGAPDVSTAADTRSKMIRAALESKMGADRAALVAMFSEHRIMLRGGREQADALMDDLIAWKGQQ